MFILYDLIFIIFAIIYLPYFLFRKKFHAGFIQRLGFLPACLQSDTPIWIHAVSVGEARVAQILVKQLRRIYPDKKFIFSTVTTTGNSIVQGFKEQADSVFYLPLDLSFITRRVGKAIKPCVCIIVETELWPNLITSLNKMNIPVILVNTRISGSSFLGYRMLKPLIKPILNRISLFCVRSNEDAHRLRLLGVSSHKMVVTGNMKYDIIGSLNNKLDSSDYRKKIGLDSKDKLIVAGSTHKGEEKIILSVYKRLVSEFPKLRLLIAPRHPERAKEVGKIAARLEFQTIFISNLSRTPLDHAESKAVFILDTIGQLLSFYEMADIVFVGGSLIKKGGQNIIEPAFFQKPIIFGPYMSNFRQISDLFLASNAAYMARGERELLKQIRFLFNNPSQLLAIGKKARQLVIENQGATEKNVERISLFISHG